MRLTGRDRRWLVGVTVLLGLPLTFAVGLGVAAVLGAGLPVAVVISVLCTVVLAGGVLWFASS